MANLLDHIHRGLFTHHQQTSIRQKQVRILLVERVLEVSNDAVNAGKGILYCILIVLSHFMHVLQTCSRQTVARVFFAIKHLLYSFAFKKLVSGNAVSSP